jgi:hypothetical protein
LILYLRFYLLWCRNDKSFFLGCQLKSIGSGFLECAEKDSKAISGLRGKSRWSDKLTKSTEAKKGIHN